MDHVAAVLDGGRSTREDSGMFRARISAWAVAVALGISASGAASAAAAGGGLDVRGWLDRPGVKLLAVEFYATWCEPCMEAVPRWKELHEEYRQRGLRLVVVATQDPEAGCVNPGWNPDDVICDDEGQLARMMGADDRLPAAFLWSWQGNLLVRKGHVDEVEESIGAWMKSAPRVDVRVQGIAKGAKVGRAELRDLVRNELGRSAKLTVVASEEERKRLDEVRRRSFSERFDDESRCELGKELSPNSLLDVKVYGSGARKRLRMGLLSLERGCLVGSAVVDWNVRRPGLAVAEGVAELVQKLRPLIEMPRGEGLRSRADARFEEEDFGESVESWEPEARGARVIVSFRADPPGVVLLDGNLLCQDTSRGCSRALVKGSYSITMQRERYKKRVERVRIEAPTELDWSLEPNFGTYAVRSDPSGLEVKVDGRAAGRTPLDDVELTPGRHEILVSDPCYYDRGKRLAAKAGERRELTFDMGPRMGALDIVAVDGAGNAQRGEAWIDGAAVGPVPGVHKVPICARVLEVKRADGSVAYRGTLAVKEKQLVHVRAKVGEASFQGGTPSDRTRLLVYMNDLEVDTRDIQQAEGTALADALRTNREVTTFARFDRMAERLGRRGVLVVPELENGQPSLRAKEAAVIRTFVKKGGVMVSVLDDPKKARGLALLREIFGWSLRSEGSPKGDHARRSSGAERLGLPGPAALPHNNDTDVLLSSSLPASAVPLYVDDEGNATVALLPYEEGFVAVLGWDFFDAKPRGKLDGGWRSVLQGLLDLRPKAALAPPSGMASEPSTPSGPSAKSAGVAFYANPGHVDYGDDMVSEGAGLEAALVASGQRVSRFDRLSGATLTRSLEGRRTLVIPDLEKGEPRLGKGEIRVLRSFVENGGALLTVLDESGKDRAAALLNRVFGWKLQVKPTPTGDRSPLGKDAARRLGFSGPSALRVNNDTDALMKDSLPSGGEVLYADDTGDAVVSVIPRGRGRVVTLGWDWYDGAPRGKQDGGWLAALRALLKLGSPQTSPLPSSASGGKKILFMSESKFADMRKGEKGAEGANMMEGLQRRGFSISPVSLGALKDAYSRTNKYQAVVVPELAKGTDRDVKRGIQPARKYLRSYVKKGGTLVVTLDQVSNSRIFQVLRHVFGWSGLRSNGTISGGITLRGSTASKFGLSTLPKSLPANNDTDAVITRTLPRGGQALYADGSGNAAVAAIPYGRGRVFVLGWDWFDAEPVGKLDGGWNRVLDAVIQ